MSENFVSRAGAKLEFALSSWSIDVTDNICADLGCSTGGFTDCLLQHGAQKVYAVDTGYGVLDWKLRNDPRVEVMERTNAMHVQLPELVDFISIDVSWTRQKNIIPHALSLLKDDGNIISLVKTHYEADKKWLYRGQVKEEFIEASLEKVKQDYTEMPIELKGIVESPIVGKSGANKEYLVWIRKMKNGKLKVQS